MLDVTVLPAFIAVIALFLAPPGPDMAFTIAVGLERGRRAAVAAILGIGTAMTVYAAAVVLGVGRLAETHPHLLDVVKLLGAGYLVWLAFTTFRAARIPNEGSGARLSGRAYARGFVVAVANPKIVLFYLAVLPQFVGDATNTSVQLAMLGAVNVASEVLLYGTIGVLAGTFHARFRGSRRGSVALNVLAGVVYLVLAVVILVELTGAADR